MSLAEVLAELPALTFAERQQIICSALELDDDGLSPQEQAIVDLRLSQHRADPSSAIGFEEMKARILRRSD